MQSNRETEPQPGASKNQINWPDFLGAEPLNREQLKQVTLFAPKPYFPTRARHEKT